MNILILEKDSMYAQGMKSLIEKSSSLVTVYMCQSIAEAVNASEQYQIDLFILSINLENETGMDFAAYLRGTEKYAMTWLIFLTSNPSYINQAYREIHCYYYMLKPYNSDDLLKKIGNLLRFQIKNRNNDEEDPILSITSKGIDYRISASSVIYIEVNYKALHVITTAMSYYFPRYPLDKIKDLLPQSDFLQCHRSYIINKNRIRSVHLLQPSAFVDMGNITIPVGNKFRSYIKDRLAENQCLT
jgi:DNA-binding LytR/AlgR family response regulator